MSWVAHCTVTIERVCGEGIGGEISRKFSTLKFKTFKTCILLLSPTPLLENRIGSENGSQNMCVLGEVNVTKLSHPPSTSVTYVWHMFLANALIRNSFNAHPKRVVCMEACQSSSPHFKSWHRLMRNKVGIYTASLQEGRHSKNEKMLRAHFTQQVFPAGRLSLEPPRCSSDKLVAEALPAFLANSEKTAKSYSIHFCWITEQVWIWTRVAEVCKPMICFAWVYSFPGNTTDAASLKLH